jgi:prolyl-tRNA editing enzyme YbaK/EbsC (Cys-tRNA(Pro) deacylase)
LGIEADQIVKSVIFWVDERPFLVYGCGTRRVDPRKLAARLQVGRKRVKLADADQVLDITGYAVGTVPPVGLKTPMPAYMDPAVRQYEVIYAGGGGIDALLKMTTTELLRVSNAEIVSMLEDEKATDDDETTAEES